MRRQSDRPRPTRGPNGDAALDGTRPKGREPPIATMAREAWRSGSVEEAVRGPVRLLAPPCPFEGSKAACPACPERSAAESKGAASKRCRRSALRSSGQNSAPALHRARRHWVAFGAARTLARQSRNRNRTASSVVISWICTSRSFLTLCETFLGACEQFGLLQRVTDV